MKNKILLVAGVVAVAAVAAGVLGTRRAAAQDAERWAAHAVALRPTDMDKMSRDLEVMRRILLKEALGVDVKTTTNLHAAYLYAAAGSRLTSAAMQPAEAYYVAGDGAVIVLRTSDPVAPPDTTVSSETGDEPPSLWDRTVADVEGRALPEETEYRVKSAYDAEKVRGLEDTILKQLAEYGARLDQLSSDEHVTVVVVGGGRNTVVNYRLAGDFVRAGHALRGLVDDDPSSAAKNAIVALGAVPNAKDPATVLTIRLSMSDLVAAGEQGLDGDALRHRARMNRY